MQSKITTRSIKQGSVLLKPGDKIKSVFLIQSGRISLCQSKGSKLVEIGQMTSGMSIGDEIVFAPLPWNLTALALRDSLIIEIPLEIMQEQVIRGNANTKVLLKALSDRSKVSYNELKTLKTNREVPPCPADATAKVFGVIFHTARAVGKPQGDATVADWPEFLKYAFEVFDESQVRLEDAVNILSKLGYVKLEGKSIHLTEMGQIEAFFDYYGNYHFKSGYEELLKTNAKMARMTDVFIKISANYPVDRGGNAHLPYKATIDAMKQELGSGFEADQLFRLEQKGLFIKRTASNDGGVLSFYKPDFEQMMLNWKILRELELWNEKGFVEMAGFTSAPDAVFDPEAEKKKWARVLAEWKPAATQSGVPKLRTGEKAAGEIWCPTCMSVVTKAQVSCQVCGSELPSRGKAA
jgi:CRP-like cAMP-binding protein